MWMMMTRKVLSEHVLGDTIVGTKEILRGVWQNNPGKRSRNKRPSRSIVSIECSEVGNLVQVEVLHMAGRF